MSAAASTGWEQSGSAMFRFFDSLSDLRDDALAPGTRDSDAYRENDFGGWYGAESMATAVDHSNGTGWDIAERIAERLAVLEPLLQRVIRRTTRFTPAVAGAVPSVPRFAAGDHRSMLRVQRPPVERPQHAVRIAFNRGALGSVSGETLVRNGAAVFALVEAVRRSGRAVDLFVVNAAEGLSSYRGRGGRGGANETITVVTQVAHAGAGAPDLAAVAFSLAHPSYHRRFVFQSRRNHVPGTPGGQWASCETPEPVRERMNATLEIDLVLLSEVRDHDQWLRERLDELGVALRPE